MEFRTIVDIPASSLSITHHSRLMMFGSCFAENIGSFLKENKFNVNVNPFGILYNPLSVGEVIHRINDGHLFTETDLIRLNGLYTSFLHHGLFSFPDKEKTLLGINESLQKANTDIKTADVFIITFGTSYVYKIKKTGRIAANCHKFPASYFDRYRLTVDEILEEWSSLIEMFGAQTEHLDFLFTVSPIRHWKDGAHENQLSKSTLLLAIDILQKKYDNVHYFPSYEILMDELRDYRFYAEDMVHPSGTAVKYMGEIFGKTFFNEETHHILKQWNSIRQAIGHRPFNKDTQEHKQFLIQTLLKLETFQKKYPYLDCYKEKIYLENQLK